MDCLNCGAKCCKVFKIPLETIDLAKLVYYFTDRNSDFYLTSDSLIADNKVIVSYNKYEGFIFNNPCALLDNNLCSVHYELVDKDSTLGRNLGVLRIDLAIKPLICRLHPYFFSKESNGFMKWIDCYETIYAVIENNDKISVDNVKKNALFEAIVKKRSLDKMIIAKQLNDFELKDFLNQKVVIK